MDSFADIRQIKFDYNEDGILIMTTFDKMARLDTITLHDYLVLACGHGHLSLEVNGENAELRSFEMLALPPYTRINNFVASDDIRCDLLAIKTETLEELLENHMEEWDSSIYMYHTNHVTTTDESRFQFLSYIDLLAFKIEQQGKPYNREVVQSIIRSVLFDILALMMEKVPESDETTMKGQPRFLLKRFMKLLVSSAVKHREMDVYAQNLNVTPYYLTKVCKEITGKTALQWIQEYTNIDIQHYLLHSSKSIKEISNELGFQNTAYFSRYFRKFFGCSPIEFREKAKEK